MTEEPKIKFSSPEEAYLYGLGQAIVELTKPVKGESRLATTELDMMYRKNLIDNIHKKAMEAIIKCQDQLK